MARTDTDGRQRPPVIAPVTEPDAEQAELLDKTHRGTGPANIFATMVHNPRLMKRLNVLGGYFVAHGLLEPRDRELVVMRTAYRAGCDYEFGRHTLLVGREGLLTDDEVERIATDDLGAGWSPQDAQLLRLADEITADDRASDELTGQLAERFSDAELIEVTLLVGFYRMLAGYLNTLDVNREEGVPGFPG